MTAIIDLTNSNPETCITYADDAVNMEAKSETWDKFFGHYPVLFKEGQEVGKLNRNNFAQFEDGTEADITSGEAGDVMIAFPRRGVHIETSSDGNTLKVSMTDNPDAEGFEYYAHTRGEVRKEIFYKGAYKGCILNLSTGLVLRSLSGKSIGTNRNITTVRNHAQANGIGYEQSGFYQLIFNQVMYILKYKNLNSQEALGVGCVSASSIKSTGNTNTKGMDFGTVNENEQVKLFGIEDFWGNANEFIDGLYVNGSFKILTTTDNFNDTGSGYIEQVKGATSTVYGYMSKPQGTSEAGFIIKEKTSTSNTYFSDYGNLVKDKLPYFGGNNNSGNIAGIFFLNVATSPRS